jgi:hypothetical protein
MFKYLVMAALMCVATIGIAEDNISEYLQNISVTIKTEKGSGSGVIFTREIESKDGLKKVNFVWTAAHVLEGIRSVRSILDMDGKTLKKPMFKDVQIVKKTNNRWYYRWGITNGRCCYQV